MVTFVSDLRKVVFSATLVSSTNKTGCLDIIEKKKMKVALNTTTLIKDGLKLNQLESGGCSDPNTRYTSDLQFSV